MSHGSRIGLELRIFFFNGDGNPECSEKTPWIRAKTNKNSYSTPRMRWYGGIEVTQ